MMRLIGLLASFLSVWAAADTLPSPSDLFTRATAVDVQPLSGANGRVLTGKFVVTLDRAIVSDDGAFWAVLDGRSVRYTFQRFFLTVDEPFPHFVGARQGDPTRQFLVQLDPAAPAFRLEALKGSDLLVFTFHYDPLSR